MSPTVTKTTPSLLTIAQLRQRRGALTEAELMHRCKDAARLELRGGNFSTDDRLDVAAQIMADSLAETNGSLPSATDPRYSLGAYCKRAQTLRRSLLRQRERDNLAADQETDRQAWTVDALTPDYQPPIATTAEAMRAAVEACRRLKLNPSKSPMLGLFYGHARELPHAVIAAELGMSPNAYDVACCRARSEIRAAYPTAAEFLRALIGETVQVIDPMTGEQVLRYVKHDNSTEAHDRTHILAEEWRDGTNAGSWPMRAETPEQARSACEVYGGSVYWRRPAPARAAANRAKHNTRQAQADALRRVGYALAH